MYIRYTAAVLMAWLLSGCQNSYPPLPTTASDTHALANQSHTVVHFEQQQLHLNDQEKQKLLETMAPHSDHPIVLQIAPAPGKDKMESMHLAFKRGEACRQQLLNLDPKRSIQVHYAPKAPINTLEINEEH